MHITSVKYTTSEKLDRGISFSRRFVFLLPLILIILLLVACAGGGGGGAPQPPPPPREVNILDRDGDGIPDNVDLCDSAGSATNWKSNSATDADGDGCRDSDEDEFPNNRDAARDIDKDNDGLIEITTPEELSHIRYDYNGKVFRVSADRKGTSAGCGRNISGVVGCNGYELMVDIDLSGYDNWQPIGDCLDEDNCPNSFNSTFDGNNRVISNLSISVQGSTSPYGVGLFGAISNKSIIKNVRVRNAKVISPTGNYVGALVGYGRGSNISLSQVDNIVVNGANFVGGMVGDGRGSTVFASSANKVTVYSYSSNVSHGYYAGGLIGSAYGARIYASYVLNANVTGREHVGGLAGGAVGAQIVSSYAALGGVSGNVSVGGLVGNGISVNIKSSYAALENVKGFAEVGGLVGRKDGDSVEYSFWDITLSGIVDRLEVSDIREGIGLNYQQLRSETTFSGIYDTWDDNLWCNRVTGEFTTDSSSPLANSTNNAWDLGSNVSYPIISCAAAEDDPTTNLQRSVLANLQVVDTDMDGIVDIFDKFPNNASESSDRDGDGRGDNADTNNDNDTHEDIADNCPYVTNENQEDDDDDDVGDACDIDKNNNGLIDITTAAELNQIRNNLNGNSLITITSTGTQVSDRGCGIGSVITECNGYELMADIDLSDYDNWQPIGDCLDEDNCFNAFNSIFEGNQWTISNLRINVQGSISPYGVGLFGSISDKSIIKNVHVRNAKVKGGKASIGILAGIARQTSKDHTIEREVNLSSEEYTIAIGSVFLNNREDFAINAKPVTINEIPTVNNQQVVTNKIGPAKFTTNGTFSVANGTLVVPDERLVVNDGTLVVNSGSLVVGDRNAVANNGALVVTNIKGVITNGTLVIAEGSMVIPLGTFIPLAGGFGYGELVAPNGNLIVTDGTLRVPGGTLVVTNGRGEFNTPETIQARVNIRVQATRAQIINSSVQGEVISPAAKFVGAMVGSGRGATISFSHAQDSYVNGNFTVGGLVGNGHGMRAYVSYAINTKVHANVGFAGGLIGLGFGGTQIFASYALNTNVSGERRHIGGLVGWSGNAEIVSSYAAGGVVSGSSSVGGLVGNAASAMIKNSYAAMRNVTGYENVGGLAGITGGSIISNSYWDASITNPLYITTNGDGMPLNSTQLSSETNFANIYADWNNNFWCNRATGEFSLGRSSASSAFTIAANVAWDLGSSTAHPIIRCAAAEDDLALTLQTQDTDMDGIADIFDLFPADPNEFSDRDHDGIGDNSDTGGDEDSIDYDEDNCPYVANQDQLDDDTDGVGNACDIDKNNNGLIEIATAAELNQMRYDLDGTYLYSSTGLERRERGCGNRTIDGEDITECNGYELVADIDLSRDNEWLPIGNCLEGGSCPEVFNGIFEGNNWTISNLNINRPGFPQIYGVGLFGAISGTSVIRNVHIRNALVNLGVGSHSVGILVGNAQETDGGVEIINSSVQGKIISPLAGWVGAVIGKGENAIIKSTYAKDTSIKAQGIAGGLVGLGTGAVIYASYARNVTLDATGRSIGGLIGDGAGADVYASYVLNGDAIAEGATHVGGLIGWAKNAHIVSSYAIGNLVSGSRIFDNNVGGLVGYGAGARIYSSYVAIKNVVGSGLTTSQVGGLVGLFEENTFIAAVNNSYWDTNISNAIDRDDAAAPPTKEGAPKTSEQLRSETTFSGIYETWDDHLWCDVATGEYTTDRSFSIANSTNVAWDLGNSTQYPLLTCPPGGAEAQRQ